MMHTSDDYSLDDLLKHLREEMHNKGKRGKGELCVDHVSSGAFLWNPQPMAETSGCAK